MSCTLIDTPPLPRTPGDARSAAASALDFSRMRNSSLFWSRTFVRSRSSVAARLASACSRCGASSADDCTWAHVIFVTISCWSRSIRSASNLAISCCDVLSSRSWSDRTAASSASNLREWSDRMSLSAASRRMSANGMCDRPKGSAPSWRTTATSVSPKSRLTVMFLGKVESVGGASPNSGSRASTMPSCPKSLPAPDASRIPSCSSSSMRMPVSRMLARWACFLAGVAGAYE
mmetsp:Transcript_3938/g.12773  ORF Transcript_3938/g.12773 Transcript_3938/m.12773 type:complete len:233 (+) Transcript_3938:629-1327(+)